MKFIAPWKVNMHFVYFENDSLISEYTSDYNLQFDIEDKGFASHPLVNPQSFSWECDGDTLSITDVMEGSIVVDDGNYVLFSETDSTLSLVKHEVFNGVTTKYETWRTWILSKI